ncbi:hypothetical protein Q9Q95_03090 [Sphingomonas sp. DG1-23]|uniref:hypothetical protein n=1 Tax=Sphingomonas sp. DG1-23 TaxID=3068316 RepID=UPI00273F368B|nr:hypothetical protein [Sphingomonas sp. DG1-23]MDP5277899.1 hypothetical protein [Sphingomonas sp. DG1-23]
MRRLAVFAVLAALAIPGTASAQLYQGKAGTAPIVLELDQGDGAPGGRYFYRSSRLDIALEGERAADGITLRARSTGDSLVLKRADTGWAGTLTTAKGRTLPVSLAIAAPPAAPAGAPADLGDYDRMQLAGLRFEAGPVERIGTRTIRWHIERLTGTRLFRIETGYAPAALGKINAALTRTHWAHVRNWFGCPGYDGGAGIDLDAAGPAYLGDTFVSYAWRTSWGCAGTAHPDFGIEGLIYDARTGTEVKLDDLLRFGKTPPPPERSDAWYAYRSGAFAEGLVALLKRTHAKEMAAEDAEGCSYDDPNVWSYPAAYLTADGLFVAAYFARVARACDAPEWAVIPWRALNGPATRRASGSR